MDIAVLTGSVSTALFVASYLPMLLKAFRTRDLDSYSRGNLVLLRTSATRSTPSTCSACHSARSGSCTRST